MKLFLACDSIAFLVYESDSCKYSSLIHNTPVKMLKVNTQIEALHLSDYDLRVFYRVNIINLFFLIFSFKLILVDTVHGTIP